MPASFARSVASGSTDTFSVPFGYLDRTHVEVRLDGVLQVVDTDYTWVTSASIQLVDGNPAAGVVVDRRRNTPKEKLVTFAPGNLSSTDLNNDSLQAIYIAEEAKDLGEDLEDRGWYTEDFGTGGTITKGAADTVAAFDADGNIVEGPSVQDVEDAQANASAAAASATAAAASATSAAASAATASAAASRYQTVALAEAATPTGPPQFIETLGFYEVGDDGGALYTDPVSVDPGASDQIEVNGFFYSRYHKDGKVNLAQHGMHLDGREETALFEDALEVAMNRDARKIIMPGRKSLLLTEAAFPTGYSFDLDINWSTLLADFNGAVAGGTANLFRARQDGTPFGNMTAGAGVSAPFATPLARGLRSQRTRANSAQIAANSGYVGMAYPEARRPRQVIVYASSDAGYVDGSDPTVTLEWYAKNGVPANETDGTLLGTDANTDAGELLLIDNTGTENDRYGVQGRRITTTTTTEYTHFWVRVSSPAGGNACIAAISFALYPTDHEIRIQNALVDGQYSTLVSLTSGDRVIDIEGYRKVHFKDFELASCGRGGTVDLVMFERDGSAMNLHNNLEVILENGRLRRNAKVEEVSIGSDMADCRAIVKGMHCFDHISSGSPFNILNCAPGSKFVENTIEGGYSGSGVNWLSKHGLVGWNWIKGMTGSNGIDAHEGIFYADGTTFVGNLIENAAGRAIFAGGTGLQIIGNRTVNCNGGIAVETAIGGDSQDYGHWLQEAERPCSGIHIQGNTSNGHNLDGGSTNWDVRLFGTSSSPIEATYVAADGDSPLTKSEYGLWTRYASVKLKGRFVNGRTGLVVNDQGDSVYYCEDATFAPEAGQSADCLLSVTAGSIKVFWDSKSAPATTLDGGFYDIAERSGGNIASIHVEGDGSVSPTTNASAGTRIDGLAQDFTPTLVGTTAAGVGTYTTQVGKYVRNGNKVWVFIELEWTAHTGTGDMEIDGLSFLTARGGIPLTLVVSGVTATAQVQVQTKGAGDDRLQLLHNTSNTPLPMDTAGLVRIAGEFYI